MKKCAMITGAMGGIGFAAVKQLISDGYDVSAFDKLDENTANDSLVEMKALVLYPVGEH